MMWLMVVITVVPFALAAMLSWATFRMARSHGIMDVPNDRSSHSIPTPRGGGIAIVIASSMAFGVLAWRGWMGPEVVLALVGGGLAVAWVGFLDDRGHVSPAIRLLVHLASAVWALAWLGGLPPIRIGGQIVALGLFGHVLATFAIAWLLNLFNFMDGIDGIAASEAGFIVCAVALLAVVQGNSGDALAPLAFGSACLGFLVWNVPPAKLFMGDVGSGYLGYVIAVLAIEGTRNDPAALWVWILLTGIFSVDATVTLIRRLLRGEALHQAHRSHAYQRLARCWSSHGRVTGSVVLVNLLWLLPCAYLASTRPSQAAWITVMALAPLVGIVLLMGAGRCECERV